MRLRHWCALFVALLALNLLPHGASAQTLVKPCLPITSTASGVTITSCQDVGSTNPLPVGISASSAGITPVVSASAEASHVLKASAGSLFSVSATNLTSTGGFLAVLNATSAPVDGAITPLACAPLPGGGSASIVYDGQPPGAYSTGIVAVVTSASTCFTKTTGVITAFISGSVQ